MRWSTVFRASLQARGIRRVQILSLRRSLSYVIQGMANIESLNLSGCYNLTDNGLGHAFVQEIGSLRALNLSLCKQITDSSLGRIAQYLKGLEVLELGGCSNVTNTGLLLIAWGLQRLKSLNLRSCRHLSDVGIGHLAGMTRSAAEGCLGLEQLTLQDCQKLTDLSLKHISRGLAGLRLLNLSFCGGISDAGLLHLSHMGSLRSLNLRSCDNISDTGIMHLAMGSLRLSGLDVSFCDKVGDQSLAYIAQGLDGLKSLSLCSCHISDDGINRMVRQMHGLRTLNIGQCVRITDKGLELIAEHLSQLTGIDLYGCTRITKRGLERITQLPCLKVLNLGLWQMTDSEKVRKVPRTCRSVTGREPCEVAVKTPSLSALRPSGRFCSNPPPAPAGLQLRVLGVTARFFLPRTASCTAPPTPCSPRWAAQPRRRRPDLTVQPHIVKKIRVNNEDLEKQVSLLLPFLFKGLCWGEEATDPVQPLSGNYRRVIYVVLTVKRQGWEP
ncbi:F-box/LRR-repeat protein 14 [Camelus ferus]|nr:F-box/LRR-repeat protein 14 [Camelus ferus]